MKKDESETDKSEIILPIRTSFSWKSSIYPPSDLHIWSSTFSKTMKFEINPDPPPRLMILLIPGNPGLCEFYDRFLNRLYQNLESNQISNQIICVGHLGLSLKYFNQDKRYLRNLQRLFFNTKRCQQFAELDDQIEFHEGFVEMISHTLDPEKTKLILIGHSVGGHIANKVLLKHPDLVYHLFNLYPTISQIRYSINGKSIIPFLNPIFLPIIHLGQFIIYHFIPKLILIVLTLILNWITKTTSDKKYLSYHSLNKTIAMIHNFNSTAATWTLGRSQMKEIIKLDQDCISIYKEKMTIFWSEEDQDWWIPKPEIDRIIKLLESTTYQNNSEVGVQEEVKKNLKNVPRWERSNNNIPHAFCLEHGERMADKCASWIKTLLSES